MDKVFGALLGTLFDEWGEGVVGWNVGLYFIIDTPFWE
jgi:hypothetical protein